MSGVTPGTREAHWAETRSLTIIVLILWFIFSFVVHWFANDLNQFSFMHFPLGYYMAAQGSLVAFVVIIFWLAHKQNKIDEKYGVAEDE